MVGTAGFEPATSCTPSRRAKPGCATSRLQSTMVSPAGKDGQQSHELGADGAELRARRLAVHARRCGGGSGRRNRRSGFGDGREDCHLELLARAGDGETLLVEQPLDGEHGLDVLAAVDSLAVLALGGLEARELGLPVAQHVGLDLGQRRHFADLVRVLLGDLRAVAAHTVAYASAGGGRGQDDAAVRGAARAGGAGGGPGGGGGGGGGVWGGGWKGRGGLGGLGAGGRVGGAAATCFRLNNCGRPPGTVARSSGSARRNSFRSSSLMRTCRAAPTSAMSAASFPSRWPVSAEMNTRGA